MPKKTRTATAFAVAQCGGKPLSVGAVGASSSGNKCARFTMNFGEYATFSLRTTNGRPAKWLLGLPE